MARPASKADSRSTTHEAALRKRLSHPTLFRVAQLYSAVNKKPLKELTFRGFVFRSLTMTYSHMGTPTLPSAILRFTSEFGMGSGGSKALWSSGKTSVSCSLNNSHLILRL